MSLRFDPIPGRYRESTTGRTIVVTEIGPDDDPDGPTVTYHYEKEIELFHMSTLEFTKVGRFVIYQ